MRPGWWFARAFPRSFRPSGSANWIYWADCAVRGHVAFTYSKQVALLLEPILRYLQRSTWINPERDALVEFLMGTVRRAIPEGLLGFFKAQGALSNEAVLGRIGLAAVLAYIDETGSPGRLVVSLDTEGARRWLGLRRGPEIRADLLGVEIDGDDCIIEAIEIKARTEPFEWTGSPPDALAHAREQVHEMERLIRQMFNLDPPDAFTPSRREILKRQVFLEALQQWEHLRLVQPGEYEDRIDRLNRLFDNHLVTRVSKRIFAVSPKGSEAPSERSIGDTPVTLLGVDWFKRALEIGPQVLRLRYRPQSSMNLESCSSTRLATPSGERPDRSGRGPRGCSSCGRA